MTFSVHLKVGFISAQERVPRAHHVIFKSRLNALLKTYPFQYQGGGVVLKVYEKESGSLVIVCSTRSTFDAK